jgi:predicted transcriptional regulator
VPSALPSADSDCRASGLPEQWMAVDPIVKRDAATKEAMSRVTIELPESLKNRIEALAAKEGYSISQFLVSAAGEKLAVMQTMEYLRQEAEKGRRADFDKYLEAVPIVPPTEGDELN